MPVSLSAVDEKVATKVARRDKYADTGGRVRFGKKITMYAEVKGDGKPIVSA